MLRNFFTKFHLSTDGYYFKYRSDKLDASLVRATLYNKKNESVDDVRVSAGWGLPERSHSDVINYFEARLQIKPKQQCYKGHGECDCPGLCRENC